MRTYHRRPGNPARIAAPVPAPGEFEVVRAFADTAGAGAKVDELASPEGLARWLVRHRLLAPGTELGEAERRRAIEVRWGLRTLIAANSGAELDPDAVARARLEGRWQLFKLCALGECHRPYFDFSQSRNGRYCTRRCADRQRSRAYRRRDKYQRQRRS